MSARARKERPPAPAGAAPVTVGSLAALALGRRTLGACPRWPADVFAVASLLLGRTGAYVDVVERWKPPEKWAERCASIAGAWRDAWACSEAPPREVTAAWKELAEHRHLEVDPGARLRTPTLVDVLLRLSSYADETAHGAPLGHPFVLESEVVLALGGSLGREVHRRHVTVLPKTHTARVGLTPRALSHHLAALDGLDVSARWFSRPWRRRVERTSLLLLPWPLTVTPRAFSAVELPKRAPFVEGHASFRYRPGPFDHALAGRAFVEATRLGGSPPDVVVLPEQAVTRPDAERLALKTGAIVVAGIHGGAEVRKNASLVCDPYGSTQQGGAGLTCFEQAKHHRWCLDEGQVRRYGLSAQLDPRRARHHWEDIELGPRELRVHALDDDLTYSVLVCEDLARQDAVASLLRAVAPSLVLALLLDGPQLRSRWPARYAGSLAEDPGSSVLTLTSYGMAQLSRPPSPVIALFGDGATSEIVELSLAPGAIGLLVTLGRYPQREHTVDGRVVQRDTLRLESVLDVHAR